MPVQIQMRRGTTTQWSNANPTLAAGEIGVDTTLTKFKVGNGSTAWNSLGYATLTFQGAYAGGTTYYPNDVVTYNNSTYICILQSTGNLPTNATYWSLLAAAGAGDVVGPATSTDSVLAVYDGVSGKLLKNSTMLITSVGYIGAPQSTNTTVAASDAGKHIYFTGGSTATLTIETNSTTPIDIGTTILVLNNNSGNLTISGAGVTFQLANGTTGNRTVATKGMASLIKVDTDTWWVTGPGVT